MYSKVEARQYTRWLATHPRLLLLDEPTRGIDVGAKADVAKIVRELRGTAQTVSGATARVAALPMHLVASVAGLRVAIVHGDATALAGWSFAHDRLDRADTLELLNAVRRVAIRNLRDGGG